MSAKTRLSVPLSLTESLSGIFVDSVPDHIYELELHFGVAVMNLTWSRDALLEMCGQNLLNMYFDGPIPSCLSKDEPPMLRWTTVHGDTTLPDHRIEYVPCTHDNDLQIVQIPIRNSENTIGFVRTTDGRRIAITDRMWVDTIVSTSPRTTVVTPIDANNSLARLFSDDVTPNLVRLDFLFGNMVPNVKWARHDLLEHQGQNLLSVFFDEPLPIYLAKTMTPELIWTLDGTDSSIPNFRAEYVPCDKSANEACSVLLRGWTFCQESDVEYFEHLQNTLRVNPRRTRRGNSDEFLLCDNTLTFTDGRVGVKFAL